MTQEMDLKKLEKNIWTSYFHDGLWDIFVSFIFLSLGIQIFYYNFLPEPYGIIPGLLVYIIGFAFFFISKKKITITRLGKVKFGQKRKRKLMIISVILFISFIVLFIEAISLSPATATSATSICSAIYPDCRSLSLRKRC